jgi:hypothetical protein
MEPPRSPSLASDANQQGGHNPVANDDGTISLWDFLQEYCHIDVNDIMSRVTAQAIVPKETDVIDVGDDAPRMQHEDDDVVPMLCQPRQHDCAKTQGTWLILLIFSMCMYSFFYSIVNSFFIYLQVPFYCLLGLGV